MKNRGGTAPTSDDVLLQAVEARSRHECAADAAREMNVPISTYKGWLRRAAKRGLMGTRPVLDGFQITQTSTQLGPEGELQREWIKQVEERSESFAVPEGHVIKGLSALTDASGNIIQQWTKTKLEEDRASMLDAIKATFESYKGPRRLPPKPKTVDADLLSVFPIADLHLGMYAWAKECGADYDVDIASELLRSSMADLVSRASPAQTAIVLDLGDYFHTDNSRNQTSRSGNPLDVDTRYAKVAQVGVELAVECIDLALQKSELVIYRKLPGNHDDETSCMLAIALAAWFRGNPRVTVDTDPSRFFMYRHGACLITATHGDELKMDDMAGFVAARWPKEWGETEFRYGYTGHIHQDKVRSGKGIRVESFNTLAAKDAWSAGRGFTAMRSMVAITHHKDRGEQSRLTVSLPRMPACPVAL